ncbi:MAG: linear amide C-N hydrolase [Bacillota bacterium]
MRRVLAILLGLLILVATAEACTIFTKADGRTVLVGSNEDWYYDGPATVRFVPGQGKRHGRICFAFYGVVQSGLNERGLFFDSATCTGSRPPYDPKKPSLGYELGDRLLAECASVGEAVAFLSRHNVTGFVRDHFFLADRSGAAAVVEYIDGRMHVIPKKGAYHLVTNFSLFDHRIGNYPCYRYDTARKLLAESKVSVADFTSILNLVSQLFPGGGTYYSTVSDLRKGLVYVYYKRNFWREVRFRLAEELAKGERVLDLAELFEDRK